MYSGAADMFFLVLVTSLAAIPEGPKYLSILGIVIMSLVTYPIVRYLDFFGGCIWVQMLGPHGW